jgi:hypothetical protein
VPEAKDPAFYDESYFAGRTRDSLPHTREVIYPLSDRMARACLVGAARSERSTSAAPQ